MNNSKIEICVGTFKFTGEGDEKWLSLQLDKIIKELNNIIQIIPQDSKPQSVDTTNSHTKTPGSIGSLAKLLKDNNAVSNQSKKFLGAAVYLSLKGQKTVKTSDVTSALRDAGQTRIGNPSDTLAKNIKKGFLEKVSDGFMVTVHGYSEYGIDQ